MAGLIYRGLRTEGTNPSSHHFLSSSAIHISLSLSLSLSLRLSSLSLLSLSLSLSCLISLSLSPLSSHPPLSSLSSLFPLPFSPLSLSLSPSLPLAVVGSSSKNRKQWNTKNRERETDGEKSIWRERGMVKAGMGRYKQRNTLHKQMGNWKE